MVVCANKLVCRVLFRFPLCCHHRFPFLPALALRLQSLTLRAHSAAEMEEWMAAIMAPLKELSTAPALPPEVEKALAALKSKELALGGAAAGGAGAGK